MRTADRGAQQHVGRLRLPRPGQRQAAPVREVDGAIDQAQGRLGAAGQEQHGRHLGVGLGPVLVTQLWRLPGAPALHLAQRVGRVAAAALVDVQRDKEPPRVGRREGEPAGAGQRGLLGLVGREGGARGKRSVVAHSRSNWCSTSTSGSVVSVCAAF